MDETNKAERLEIAGEGREKVFVMGRNALAKLLGTAQLFSTVDHVIKNAPRRALVLRS